MMETIGKEPLSFVASIVPVFVAILFIFSIKYGPGYARIGGRR